MPRQVLINGKMHDSSSVDLTLDGEEGFPFAELAYGDSLSPGIPDGSGVQSPGRTRGKYKTDGCSITLWLRHFNDLVEKFGDGFYEREFDISVTYRDDDGDGVISDTLKSCRISKAETQVGGDDKALQKKCELSVMYILQNGKKPISNLQE